MTFWERQDHGDSTEISGCRDGAGDEQVEHGGSLRAGKLLCVTVVVDMVVMHLAKPVERPAQSANPDVKRGLQFVTTYQ